MCSFVSLYHLLFFVKNNTLSHTNWKICILITNSLGCTLTFLLIKYGFPIEESQSWIRRRRLSTVLFHLLFSVSKTICSKDVCTRSLWRRLIWQMHSCNACAMILEVYFAAHLRLCQGKIARVIQNLNAFETRCNVTISYLDLASDFPLIIFVRNVRPKKKYNHGLGLFPKQSFDFNPALLL